MNDYFTALTNTLLYLPSDVIQRVTCVLHEARLNKRMIFVMGNGGSASTASHFAADLSKNTYNPEYPSFRAISLADNMAIFSAYANDEGYENVFARQVASLADPGDIVIAISASGNSMNVVRAVEVANQIGATTIGFTGFTGGKVGNLVDIHLHVPSTIIEQVEDIHLLLEHMICKNLRENIAEFDALVHSTANNGNEELVSKPGFHIEQESAAFQLLNNLTQATDKDHGFQSMLYQCLQLSLEGTGADSGSLIAADD
ncbi:MAG: SIS domain-containing protein, partial [Omnitrophica WOR_2 bacterium]